MKERDRNEEIVEHYKHYWGDISRTLLFEHESQIFPWAINIVEFAPQREDHDWCYATVGMSYQSLYIPNTSQTKDYRTELMIYSGIRNDEIALTLFALALYPFKNRTFLAHKHTIVGEKEGVISGSPLTDLLFLYPMSEEPSFGVVQHQDGTHTHILWTIPIYPSERELIKRSGWESLEELFFQQKTDTSDFMRAPVI